jgi:hypothetical protein
MSSGFRANAVRVAVVAVVACIFAATTVASAGASNRCTRYAGYPRGIWNSSSCGSLTGYDRFYSSGGPLATNSTANRDTNYMNASGTLCEPLQLNVWFYNPSTGGTSGSKSIFCVSAWQWSGGGSNSYAECELYGGSSFVDAECKTTWTQ